MTIRAWWVLVALLIGACAGLLDAQPRMMTLAIGRFGGTDDEIGQCYFSVGAGASLALHPTGEPCVLARELVGRTGTLLFVPD